MTGYRDALDTPSLVIHDAILQRNIERMAALACEREVTLRPHFKTHKTAEVVRRQRAAVATGVVCAKLGEAEALAASGAIDDIFIANQIVGQRKVERLATLAARVKLRVAVDSIAGATGLEQGLAPSDQTLDVVIELNTGVDRAGVLPGDETLALANAIRDEAPHLRLIGLMTYEGHAYGVRDAGEREAIARDSGEQIVATAELLREHGFDISVVSMGCTPTALYSSAIPGVTEVRAGNYAFNDNSVFQMGGGPDDCALRVLATVVSRPAPDRAVLDAGSKALSNDKSERRTGYGYEGFGYLVDYPDATLARLSEEHGVVLLPEAAQGMRIGEQVEIIPNHACQTVNLYDEMHLVRDGQLAETWAIIGRGKVT